MNIGNWFMALLLRSPLHGLASRGMMLISYRGRKSGRAYATPVNYQREGDRLWVVSLRERSWWRNLRGGAPVTVRLQGQERRGRGEAIEDEAAVAAALLLFLRRSPAYARYLRSRLGMRDAPEEQVAAQGAKTQVVVRVDLAD